MALMTRKAWGAYKKKSDIPDGIGGRISIGSILEKYEKSKKTDADFKKVKKQVADWAKVAIKAEKGKYKKHVTYVSSLVDVEEAEREALAQEAERIARAEEQVKVNKRRAQQLTKIHANLNGLFKEFKTTEGLFEAERGDDLYRDREKIVDKIAELMDDANDVAGFGHIHMHKAMAQSGELRMARGDTDEYFKKAKTFLRDMLEGIQKIANNED